MRGQLVRVRPAQAIALGPSIARPSYICWQCRSIQISASPATDAPKVAGDAFGASGADPRDSAGRWIEQLPVYLQPPVLTLCSRCSLRSHRLPLLPALRDPVGIAETLHPARNTRLRGGQGRKCRCYRLLRAAILCHVTNNRLDQAQSTLSILSPLSRAFLGVPFLYQRITSTTPITALIATKSPTTTFTILHLDGTTDWMVSQRNSLLAWTGHTLSLSPRIQRGLSLAHWGSTHLTGRGLAALSAPGQTYQVTLGEGEELVLHPSHVVAYSINRNPPQPFRLKSTSLRLQIPALPASLRSATDRLVPEGLIRFWSAMRDTGTYKFLARLLFGLRTTARRSVWGDRLFLQFKGPTTIIMSSRGVRVRDTLTRADVNEIADTEAGVVPAAVELATKPKEVAEPKREDRPVAIHVAAVGKDGKVSFEDAKDLKEFVR